MSPDPRPLLPASPGSRIDVIRQWLIGTFVGRAFLVGASIKLVAFLLALILGRSRGLDAFDAIGDIALVAATVAARLSPVRRSEAPPALARAAQVDRLLPLHRLRAGAAGHCLLPRVGHAAVPERQRLRVAQSHRDGRRSDAVPRPDRRHRSPAGTERARGGRHAGSSSGWRRSAAIRWCPTPSCRRRQVATPARIDGRCRRLSPGRGRTWRRRRRFPSG